MNPPLHATLFLALVSLVLSISCRKDPNYEPSMGNLEFSKDTVYLDTTFTNTATATYALKVYNRSTADILIPQIALERGEDSGYQLNVDGQAGKKFADIPLLAGDSLFIFIESKFDIAAIGAKTYLYTDALVFDSGPRMQRIPLVTLVKDAIFLYPGKHSESGAALFSLGTDAGGMPVQTPGFYLNQDELVMRADKPYVVYGYAAPPAGQTLRIEAGASLFFHKDSGLYIHNGARLEVIGDPEDSQEPGDPVIFQGDRMEAAFADVPGQWGGLWLDSGVEHVISHATIRNATMGIYLRGEQSSLEIRNTQVLNSLLTNIYVQDAIMDAENLVLGNAGVSSLVCSGSGPFTFRHCTLANFWSEGPRSGPCLRLIAGENHSSTFISCILDGNAGREIGISGNPEEATVRLTSSMVRYSEEAGDRLEDLLVKGQFTDVLLNANPAFLNPQGADFRIGPDSEGIGLGHPATALAVPQDLAGKDRTDQPDIGAFQHLPAHENVIGNTKM